MTTARLISHPISVQRDIKYGLPVSFVYEGQEHGIKEIEATWQDWGFPGGAPRRKDWRMRRHRNFYRIVTSGNEVYEIYHDRGTKPGPGQWVLHSRMA